MKAPLDAIVVGAGPGGSATAYHLARRGRNVLLLERHAFPRDKSCGDGVTRSSVRLLAEMGLGDRLARFQSIRGIEVRMRNRGSRIFEYPSDLPPPRGGVVVPRIVLDEMVARRAVDAGAVLWERARATGVVWEGGDVVGVTVARDGVTAEIRAPIVVAADGAPSALGRQAGLAPTAPDELGVAIRGYYSNIDGLSDLLEIEMPLLDMTDRYLLPSYAWIFPTGEKAANVGIGLFERSSEANVRTLMERLVADLRAGDKRFAHAEPAGPWRGAPLRFDFSPERSTRPGLVLVGDAAGLISPFTGEGISFALESGKLAAEAIDHALEDGEPRPLDLSAYRRALGARYTGYFEAGRHGAQRYRLIWRVLNDTFDADKPAFRMARQAVLFPEGVGESFTQALFDDVAPFLGQLTGRVRADLATTSQVLIDAIRKDWPFVARNSIFDKETLTIPLRPATVLLLASYVSRGDVAAATQLSAALELGHLGALSHLSIEDQDGHESGGGTSNWGNVFAVLTGDYLLAKAYAMTAFVSPQVSVTFADAVGRACEARVREVRNAWRLDVPVAEHLVVLRDKLASLFEVPALVGAALGDLAVREVESVQACARALGIAYQLASEVLELYGQPSRLSSMIDGQLAQGLFTTPFLAALEIPATRERLEPLLAQHPRGDEDLRAVIQVVQAAPVRVRTVELARSHLRRAESALLSIRDAERRPPLAGLLDYVRSQVDSASRS